ncbi:PROPROTEIN CONVERTASE SUBTILISIN/KEXIN [Salix purpurea]|uniref:PROPROTEIN CONVERTASE SUBTILISIN/KEXIN n=1 Tax=Salix purpurea TaxID=77065 RepID=A0A9Q0Z1J9_SALPP|nr:PROPROTEIN CONVERTASE SUBTILISIN/KEXIN [Salix purpurea]
MGHGIKTGSELRPKVYIVFIGGRPKSDISALALHISMLQNVVGRLEQDSNADILAAFDDAIADGVDIISLSVGGFSPGDHFNDSIATGAFHAMKKGLLASISAGNSGPDPAKITNYSPWFLSVAASTIYRKIVTRVKLGNRAFYEASKMHGTVPSKQMVSERIYIQQFPFTSFSPGAEKPTATILKSIQRDDGLVPSVVSFSSRGPSPITNDITKPDLAAPGADILAAWSQPFSMSAETNPMKAINPGLIYDAGEEDYVKFLCGLGYSRKTTKTCYRG